MVSHSSPNYLSLVRLKLDLRLSPVLCSSLATEYCQQIKLVSFLSGDRQKRPVILPPQETGQSYVIQPG